MPLSLPPAIFAARPIDTDHDQLAAAMVFRALSHPKRLAILRALLTHEETLSIKQIEKAIWTVGVWEHIKVLQAAGLVEVVGKGRNATWQVVPGSLGRVQHLLDVSAATAALHQAKEDTATWRKVHPKAGRILTIWEEHVAHLRDIDDKRVRPESPVEYENNGMPHTQWMKSDGDCALLIADGHWRDGGRYHLFVMTADPNSAPWEFQLSHPTFAAGDQEAASVYRECEAEVEKLLRFGGLREVKPS